ncbi:MAG: peptidylprolyl isomerase [Dehalococcoidia bacterium]|nr:peptidylprolyl isomerase [Dehalococcoidia bacterium]|tara:strand:- start:1603 stop:2103 length:501 start_codon:yes stop_codon:yes gene_type:complete
MNQLNIVTRWSVVLLLLFFSLAIVQCGGQVRVSQNGDIVTVHYTGTLDTGEVFDSSRDRDPFQVTIGSGQVIPGFDEALKGLSVGDTVTKRMEPENAYGLHRADLVVEAFKDELPSDVIVGQVLQGATGGIFTIVSIEGDIVELDGNHRLAGHALTFEIEMIEIKD